MLSNPSWDVMAGLLLVREAGGLVYDYNGSPYSAESRYTLASVPSLVEPVRQIVADRAVALQDDAIPRYAPVRANERRPVADVEMPARA